MNNIRKIAGIGIFIIFFLVSACSQATPTQMVVEASPSQENKIVPTSTPEPTRPEPTKSPTLTELPSATATEEIIPPSQTPTSERFIPMIEGNANYIDSNIADETWKKDMAGLARNQAIPAPYEWQYADLPNVPEWKDLFSYYKNRLKDDGWKITSDGGEWVTQAGGDKIYIGGFLKKLPDHREKISVLYYPLVTKGKCFYIVFYSTLK